MESPVRAPWNPDRRWADPLIALLGLLVLLAASSALVRRKAPRPPAVRVGLAPRVEELLAAGREAWPHLPRPRASARTYTQPWDRALAAVVAAEAGALEASRPLALEGTEPAGAGAAFRRCYRAAYLGEGRLEPGDVAAVRTALGNGWAARRLEARLVAGPQGDLLREEARAWAGARWALLALGSAGLTLLVGAGAVLTPLLLFTRLGRAPRALPTWGMPWRAALLVLLLWLSAYLVAAPLVAQGLGAVLPLPRAWLLPLMFSTHAALGLGLLTWAEGRPLGSLWRSLTAAPRGIALGWGAAFLAVAVALVLAAGLLASPYLRSAEPPQQELLELFQGRHGAITTLLLFVTVAGVAPLFEETFFRGFLLPWLAPRLGARWGARTGAAGAVLLSGLAFGAMHLQPAALHSLSTLGVVLGWAIVRAGDLRSAILVHAAWNAGVFLLVRILA